jgi:adenine-specific DNA-methyltransferase
VHAQSPEGADSTDFYKYDGNWQNRMILGDSLQVMASLAEREGLRGKVQCIYIDPPYGIKFNSNFQGSTTSRDVRDGNAEHITREPEQVKAFRDTWRDGIHSYLTYLRDRLTVARDLLADSGSIFLQIGDENVHRVRAIMDEVFGEGNFLSEVHFRKTGGAATESLANVVDHRVWFSKDKARVKYRQLFQATSNEGEAPPAYSRVLETGGEERAILPAEREDISFLPESARLFQSVSLENEGMRSGDLNEPFEYMGRLLEFRKGAHWKTGHVGLTRLAAADRIQVSGRTIRFRMCLEDYPVQTTNNVWGDVMGATGLVYVVQTNNSVIQRCILMTTDPGDLVLDPTCGSGTTAYAAEQRGRRWITIDTSRVSLALARARIMGARYGYYLLADSRDGQIKESELTRRAPSSVETHGDIRLGFVYERVPHVQLKDIVNNGEIDVIWEQYRQTLEPLRAQLNAELSKAWEEWEIPREADAAWPDVAKKLHADWWQQRIARQKEIDASIAAKAEFEYLYDKPYEDRRKVRVAGPFTVESLLPHRVLTVDDDDELKLSDGKATYGEGQDFASMILENLRMAGVQQAHKEDKIAFTSLVPWPGHFVCAEGIYPSPGSGQGDESGSEKRAGIFIGPEFGTVTRVDLVEAAKEAGDAGFDVLVACAFNYDAHSTEFSKLGRVPVLKARMNADLHMADDLKNTGKGNLFVIFGEPDISILDAGPDGEPAQIRIKINGVDVFHPNTGEVRSDGPEGIACWFIDTDYNQESFFVRHAYFLGANDPYKSLKTTLRAEINEDAWATLNSDTSRPFDKPESGRLAVKVINHLGDEVMKVFRV